MNKGYKSALASLLTTGFVVATVTLSVNGGQANAASPAPNHVSPKDAGFNWNNPIDFVQGGFYDNAPNIAASQTNGAVTIAWTRTENGGTNAYITQASNPTVGSGSFTLENTYNGDDQKMGNVVAAHDSLGNRHVAFWALDSGATTGQYFMVDASGHASRTEEVPGTRGTNRKNVAIAIGPDNSVHALFAANLSNIYYYHRTPQGNWDVQGEQVPVISRPTDISLGVTTQGVVMVAFKDNATFGSNSDIYTTVRPPSGGWSGLDDTSAPCCNGCPYDSHTYLPALSPDPFGGMRMAWSDERCDPVADPPSRDLYYREWLPATGWTGQPLVRVVNNSGDSYNAAIAVDSSGTAHLSWSDTTSSPINYFRAFYTYGSGTTFAPVQIPADPYFPSSYQKDTTIDVSPGYVHVTFSSDRNDSRKDSYYQFSPFSSTGPPPTPTPLPPPPTPVPPTATPVPPTPTPVPPPCPNERFKDVCPDSSFYLPILALNDQGVLSGYGSAPPCPYQGWVPCFLPNANITRQQTAKVITLAARLPNNISGAPHFTDVPSGNPFFNNIETAANAGIIGGYACGGPGEPCDAQNRPYYRPLNQVTRGQLSKMDSQAFNFNEAVSGQSFEDVAPASPFYLYIERLSRRGVIGGYTCGGPGEPCGVGNRPYFRPNSNVTRGQAAKIVFGAQQQPTPTPTPAPTNTPTHTAVPTNTIAPTSTNTAVPTNTSTPTSTNTNTPTITVVPTNTSTPTNTAIATATPPMRYASNK